MSTTDWPLAAKPTRERSRVPAPPWPTWLDRSAARLMRGPTPWLRDSQRAGPGFNDLLVSELEGVDTPLFGRRAYAGMTGYWPTEAAADGGHTWEHAFDVRRLRCG